MTTEQRPLPAERLLQGPVVVVNVGLSLFAEALQSNGTPVVHVDWRPPARGNADLMAALKKLSGQKLP